MVHKVGTCQSMLFLWLQVLVVTYAVSGLVDTWIVIIRCQNNNAFGDTNQPDTDHPTLEKYRRLLAISFFCP